jgi:hypothetical protein
MAPDDANDPSESPAGAGSEAASRPQDPLVERRRPDPAQPPEPAVSMVGFLGDSDRPDYRRLYLTRDLDYYAEFRVDDVIDLEPIPQEQPPFPGEQATRLSLRREATIDYTRVRPARLLDEFDVDVRLGRRRRVFDRRRGFYVEPKLSDDTRCDSVCDTWCHINTCMGTCPGDQTCPDTCIPPCPEVLLPPYQSFYGDCL